MDWTTLGKGILVVGAILVVVGGLLWFFGRAGLPFGRLPGDIRIEREGLSCYVPIVSMILLSLFLTVVINIIIRLFNR